MHSVSPLTYVRSWLQSRNKSSLFDNLEAYVLFIGHPRSGSSVTGSLLNAHRNALVCNELNCLRYVKHGYRDRKQLLWLHCMRDQMFERLGRKWTGYNYQVDGGHQGTVDHLKVVGDKKAARTAEAIAKSSRLLHQLQDIVAAPVRLAHVMRHPMDVISRICVREQMSLEVSTRRFWERCEVVQRVIEEREFPLQTVYLEEMIAQPIEILTELATFCRLEPTTEYIRSCADALIDKPRESRSEITWPASARDAVLRRCEQFPYLQRYVAVESHTERKSA